MKQRKPRYTRTDTHVPDTTLFRERDDRRDTGVRECGCVAGCRYRDRRHRHVPAAAGPFRGGGEGDPRRQACAARKAARSEEPTSELQSLMRLSYAVFCLKKQTYPHSFFILTFFSFLLLSFFF